MIARGVGRPRDACERLQRIPGEFCDIPLSAPLGPAPDELRLQCLRHEEQGSSRYMSLIPVPIEKCFARSSEIPITVWLTRNSRPSKFLASWNSTTRYQISPGPTR